MRDKIYIVIVMDGATDHLRINGKSPLQIAHTPYLDLITKEARTGMSQTLYPDLPKDSVVAQLGILGYDPYLYFPKGRSFFEVPDNVAVGDGDVVFRVNIVSISEDNTLESYNAKNIQTEEALKIIDRINAGMKERFSEFSLYNISGFRNILIIKKNNEIREAFSCIEPHERENDVIDCDHIIKSEGNDPVITRINQYFKQLNELLYGDNLGMIPWGYSLPIKLPPFKKDMKSCIIGNMDFLNGFGREMNIDFFRIGNSSWDTDYEGKGNRILEAISENYNFIYCHINAPDEASHMNDVDMKTYSIEMIDKHIFSKVYSFFSSNLSLLGGVLICPDHYTNINIKQDSAKRRDAHSLDPVPYVIWDGKQKDDVHEFSENIKDVKDIRIINHTTLIKEMGL
jgi:2,3-bisphosphoglycerate-independent phosphoglycerate mutase